jgi:MFS family permease
MSSRPATAGRPTVSTPPVATIETRTSWVVATIVLALLSFTYGAPLIVVVALKPIAETLDVPRAIPSLAAALVWFGTGSGGIAMGLFADRIGVRWTVLGGTIMMGAGLLLSALGSTWSLLVGHGLLIGLLGSAGIYPPLLIYVSRWFDRRRGTALALISSGQYIAGVVWPSLFQVSIDRVGWQRTMVGFAVIVVVIVVPIALWCLRLSPPTIGAAATAAAGPPSGTPVLGLRPNTAMLLLALAPFFCCIPMAMPTAHLVALCTDDGISAEQGALMLSMLLGLAFASRQFWGWVADNLGGLRTVLLSSIAQTVSIFIYVFAHNEVGLYAASAVYGLGFAGIIPAYVLAIRDLYPSREASWRIPIMLLSGMTGMALGSWLGGAMFDRFGHYGPAFELAFVCNLINVVMVGALVLRQQQMRMRPVFG